MAPAPSTMPVSPAWRNGSAIGQQFCGCAFDDDVGQRLEFADRHSQNGATEM
jgi:hypothetical protein